jgi:hypothetical protein
LSGGLIVAGDPHNHSNTTPGHIGALDVTRVFLLFTPRRPRGDKLLLNGRDLISGGLARRRDLTGCCILRRRDLVFCRLPGRFDLPVSSEESPTKGEDTGNQAENTTS